MLDSNIAQKPRKGFPPACSPYRRCFLSKKLIPTHIANRRTRPSRREANCPVVFAP